MPVGVEDLAVPEPGDDVGHRDRLHQTEDLLLGLALPSLQPGELDRLMDADLHLVQAHGLDEEALGAFDDGRNREGNRWMGGQEDEGQGGVLALDPPEDLEPVHLRHVEIAEDDVGVVGEEIQALVARSGLDHIEAAVPEARREGAPLRWVVLYVEDLDVRHCDEATGPIFRFRPRPRYGCARGPGWP